MDNPVTVDVRQSDDGKWVWSLHVPGAGQIAWSADRYETQEAAGQAAFGVRRSFDEED